MNLKKITKQQISEMYMKAMDQYCKAKTSEAKQKAYDKVKKFKKALAR